MLHYLINCSAIWLMSLFCFDVFLRRSILHSYNRIYLIGTLLAGMFIPLFSFVQKANFSQQTKEVYGLEKTFAIKSNIVSAAQINSSQSINWEIWVWAIYLLGVLFTFSLLLADIIKTFRLYWHGSKTTIEGLWLVETKQNHSPFSFFGFIFMCNSKTYSDEQLTMILAHEKRHNTLWHGLDLLLMQLCKIAFWFQPLIYLYLQRLRMVHEYQADKAVAKPLAEYGNFLLEQNTFTPTPQMAHSFFYSPLKNRILMLTRKSSTWSKSKSLLIIPVVGIAIMCFSKDAFSDNKQAIDGNKVTYKGNTFELYAPPGDTVYIENPMTGKMEMKVMKIEPAPIKMNNIQLLTADDVEEIPVLKGTPDNRLMAGASGQNRALLEKLEDGEYRISVRQLVVGKEGEILYFKWDGIENTKWENGKYLPTNPQNIKEEFDTRFERFVEKLEFHPAIKEGKPIVCSMYDLEPFTVVVKNHQVSFKK